MRLAEDYCKLPNGEWRTRQFDLDSPVDMVRYVARYQYSWPGGYQMAIVADDGGLICSKCVRDNYHGMLHSTKGQYHDGWQASGITHDGELENCACDNCDAKLGY